MSILAGTRIEEEVKAGRIRIDPFDPKQLNPASYDITLGTQVKVYRNWVDNCGEDLYAAREHPDGRHLFARDTVLDPKAKLETHDFEIDPDLGWVLKPRIGYLMCTREIIHTDHYVMVLDGKSSIGRLFIKVHETAGYFDPGFVGQGTLEVTSMHQVRVYPGMRIGQIRFHQLEGEPVLYSKVGHYRGEAAMGAVASLLPEFSR
jgi:dCTP deaminase